MSTPEWALQEAIHTALSADTALATQLGAPARLYDTRPDDIIFPYAIYGRCQTKPVNADPGTTHEILQTLNVYSRYGGKREAKLSLGAIRDVLHQADLPLTGWTLVSLRVIFTDVLRAPDGFTTQGIIRLRALVDGG